MLHLTERDYGSLRTELEELAAEKGRQVRERYRQQFGEDPPKLDLELYKGSIAEEWGSVWSEVYERWNERDPLPPRSDPHHDYEADEHNSRSFALYDATAAAFKSALVNDDDENEA